MGSVPTRTSPGAELLESPTNAGSLLVPGAAGAKEPGALPGGIAMAPGVPGIPGGPDIPGEPGMAPGPAGIAPGGPDIPPGIPPGIPGDPIIPGPPGMVPEAPGAPGIPPGGPGIPAGIPLAPEESPVAPLPGAEPGAADAPGAVWPLLATGSPSSEELQPVAAAISSTIARPPSNCRMSHLDFERRKKGIRKTTA